MIERALLTPTGAPAQLFEWPRQSSRAPDCAGQCQLRAFGFNNPVLIDAEGLIIAGHGRVEAAKLLGKTEVLTFCLAHMSEAEKRVYVIADNRLAEKAGWDEEILAIEFETLFELMPELDLTVTGFEIAEIDLIIGDQDTGAEPDALDEVSPSNIDAPVVTRPGDLWQLGGHRVLCADATQEESYVCLLQGEQAQMVFADPPYNVPISGHVSGLGHAQHAEFPMASGEMSEAAYTAFLTSTLGQIESHSGSGAIAFVCMDWRHLHELLVAARAAKLTHKNLCVWVKTNAGMKLPEKDREGQPIIFDNYDMSPVLLSTGKCDRKS
jgi:hypothetical protein